MQVHAPASAKKGLLDKVALASLVGMSVLAVLGVTMVTVYLNRLTDSTEALDHSAAMPAYMGRPAAVVGTNGMSPINILILGTVDGKLRSVAIANLSASRRSLTLIVAPDELTVDGGSQTLASTYAMDPSITVRAMEGLTQTRMDHQVQLDLSCLVKVTDETDSLALSGSATSAQLPALHLADSAPSADALASGTLVRTSLIALDQRYSVLDPGRFARIIDQLNPCMKVDAQFTPDVVQGTVLETSIHPSDIRLWLVNTDNVDNQLLADPTSLGQLRSGLASPQLESTAEYSQHAMLPKGP